MKKAILLLIILIIGITGCITGNVVKESKEPFCRSPYIEYKLGECCLDKNDNSVCDVDEKVEVTPSKEDKKVEIREGTTIMTNQNPSSRIYPVLVNGTRYSVEFMGFMNNELLFRIARGDSLTEKNEIENLAGILPDESQILYRFPLKFNLLSYTPFEHAAAFELVGYYEPTEKDYISLPIQDKMDYYYDEYNCEMGGRIIFKECQKIGKKANVVVTARGISPISGVIVYYVNNKTDIMSKNINFNLFYEDKPRVFVVDLTTKEGNPIKEIRIFPITQTGDEYTVCKNQGIILNPDTDCKLPG